MIAEFVIHAAPVGKARPRVTSHGTYTPKKTKDYEALVQHEYKAQCRNAYFDREAIRMIIEAHFSVPKSKPQSIKSEMLAGRIRPTIKCDADNCAKAVMDALNGIAYADDSQIVELLVIKQYGIEPCVIVKIQEVMQ
jgi:Holliday junction resolvase RusA-like endonuclease